MAAPPWVILSRVPRLVHAGAGAQHAADFSVSLRAPPRVTLLTAGPSALPSSTRADNQWPYVLFASPEGLLLRFSAAPGYFADGTDLVVVRRFLPQAAGGVVVEHRHGATSTAPADRVPARTGSMPATYDAGRVGLAPTLVGGYVVAELRIAKRSTHAKLLRFFSCCSGWLSTETRYPLAAEDREWFPDGVVSVDDRLWWFDLSWGILSCHPSAVEPALFFHDLPPGRNLGKAVPDVHTVRCVCVSGGMLRYVEIARDRDGWVGEEKVILWTGIPTHNAHGAEAIEWDKADEVRFSEIWDEDSYRATNLPTKIPAIVLVSPRNPFVVYFFLENCLIGIDVPGHLVVQAVNVAHELVAPTSSRRVLPWDLELPPSFSNDLVEVFVPSQERPESSSAIPEAD